MNGRLPELLIVGSAKSGTTTLYHCLNQHPEVFMSPVKEPLFFSALGVKPEILARELYPVSLEDIVVDYDDYLGLFADAGAAKVAGEASVYYLLDHRKAIANIRQTIPHWRDLKIVIILRNPVDACFSHYQMYSQYMKNFLGESDILDFEESLADEPRRIAEGYLALAHFHWFFYYQQVKDYLDNFDHVRVYFQSDLKNNPEDLLVDLFEFLDIDKTFIPDIKGEKYNVSGAPRSNLLYRFLISESLPRRMLRPLVRSMLSPESKQRIVQKIWGGNMKKVSMAPEMRQRLIELYRDDILKLQGLTGRDLSDWLA